MIFHPQVSITALFLALMCPMAALAGDDQECNYEGTQQQMNACAARDFAVADRELNEIYGKVMNTVGASDRKQILSAQRAWLKQRDPDCRREANDEAEGGSMWPLVYDGCRTELTRTRSQALRKWLN